MADLPPIEPSIETFFWLSSGWKGNWPTGWVRREILENHVQGQLVTVLDRFGPLIAKPYPALAQSIVSNMIKADAALHINNAVAGDYYAISENNLTSHRQERLARDPLRAQIDQIGVALFDDVFAVYAATDLVNIVQFEVPSTLAPAADRVVQFTDNQPDYENVVAAVNKFHEEALAQNDFGSMSHADVAVAKSEIDELRQSLLRENGRPRRLWDQARSTLGWIGKEAAGAVIGVAALALLAVIFNFLRAFF